MSVFGPAASMPAPPLAAPATGLLRVASVLRGDTVTLPDPADGTPTVFRWTAGFGFRPEGFRTGRVYDPCSAGTVTASANAGAVRFQPYVIEAEDDCSAIGSLDGGFEDRAERLLNVVTWKRVAREFWSGDLTVAAGTGNRYLTDGLGAGGTGATAILSGTLATPVAVSARLGIALMEDYLGSTAAGGLGMMHTTRSVVSKDDPNVANTMFTNIGTPIALDGGYPGTGPTGAPAITTYQRWLFGTDPVEVLLGDPFLIDRADSVDRSVNTVRVIAQRYAAATCNFTRHAAVLIDLTL